MQSTTGEKAGEIEADLIVRNKFFCNITFQINK